MKPLTLLLTLCCLGTTSGCGLNWQKGEGPLLTYEVKIALGGAPMAHQTGVGTEAAQRLTARPLAAPYPTGGDQPPQSPPSPHPATPAKPQYTRSGKPVRRWAQYDSRTGRMDHLPWEALQPATRRAYLSVASIGKPSQ
jgi:hypothetical protein